MEIGSASSPVRDVYGRMRRLGDAIADPDSSTSDRWRWTEEHEELAGELAGLVGTRTAGGIQVLDHALRPRPEADGRVPRITARGGERTDLYL